MKRLIPLVAILVLLLAGCQGLLPVAGEPTPSDDEMATRVAQILTTMPTATVEPTAAPDVQQPTTELSPTDAPADPTATLPAPTETQAPEPTDTVEPTATAIVPTATATATATPPAGDPKLALGNPGWVDNMDNGDYWPKGSDLYSSIDWENGQMILQAESDIDGWRLSFPTLKNFYLEMTMKPGDCSGSDHYGMILRVPEPSKADQGYLFGLTCDGRYSLRRWNGRVGTKGEMVWLINWTASDAILEGSNQTNRLGLLAQNSRLVLYVNGVQVNQVNDDTFTAEGGFGVFVGQDETEDFTIYVDQASYWEDPNL
ncbi:MAG TPA: hypothetical protein VFF68_13225 [Anaerolineaceae bacterium]|nr:hypothetical protein [Anaerolineaceae bacterium]